MKTILNQMIIQQFLKFVLLPYLKLVNFGHIVVGMLTYISIELKLIITTYIIDEIKLLIE